MTVVTKSPAQISFDDKGRAWIAGTTFKVQEIVVEHLAHGWSPEEIYFQHAGQISMAQIHGALSYYYDHQSELDSAVQEELREVADIRAQVGESPLRMRLRAAGKLA